MPDLVETEKECDPIFLRVVVDEPAVGKEPTEAQKRYIFDCIMADALSRGFLRRELFE